MSWMCIWRTAWRVLIALEEKHLPYRSVCVSFSSGVLKAPFFRALNPRMRVPVLVEPVENASQELSSTGKSAPANIEASSPEVASIAQGISHLLSLPQQRVVVYESTAILEYLERKYASAPSMPSSLPLYAIAQSRMHEANEILSVVGDLVVYLRRFPLDKRNPSAVAAKWATLEAELNLWERYLDGRLFLVDAETPYLCDFTLFTNVAYAVRCGLQLDGLYPRLAVFYARLCARESVATTWPPHWRDSGGSKVLTKCFYCRSTDASECSCCEQQQEPPSSASSSYTTSPPQSQSQSHHS